MMRNFAVAKKKADFESIERYDRLTGDGNPIHTDRAFAAATEMGGIIAHGTMSLSLIWHAIELAHGVQGIEGSTLAVRFVRPVREDEVVTAGGASASQGGGVYDVYARNQRSENVIEGTWTPAVHEGASRSSATC